MPQEPIIDVSTIDTGSIAYSREEVYQVNPHRYEFQQLDGIYFMDTDREVIAGYRDVRDDEFWVRGHIPGRPIFPGVLMMETAAQMVGFYVMSAMPEKGFLGFAGVDEVKFRSQVVPGQRIVMLGKMIEMKARRCKGMTQAFVDGKQVYEGIIIGMWI